MAEMADINNTPSSGENEEVFVTMENLFLYTLNELEGNLGYLITHRFGRAWLHAKRVRQSVARHRGQRLRGVRIQLRRPREVVIVDEGIEDVAGEHPRVDVLEDRRIESAFGPTGEGRQGGGEGRRVAAAQSGRDR